MGKPLRVLMVEDSEDDVLLTVSALKKGGCEPEYERVETADAMRKALREKAWDVILCDYQMPKFNGLAAIALLKETGIDIPLIIVSGAIGEETAVECMRLGAHDYVMKGNLSRLVPAVERELKEAESRSNRRQAEEALRENEDRFRKISSMISDVAYSCSMKEDGLFSIDWMEGGVERISGYSIEEIKAQKCWRSLVIEEDLALFNTNVTGLPPGSHASCELRIRHKNDGIVWVSSYAECVTGKETPESFLLYGALVDITERKHVEEERRQNFEKVRKALGVTIHAMAVIVETRDPYTAGHQRRVADLARTIASEMDLDSHQIDGIRMAGVIHDIGKISIPAEILSKPTRLTELEFQLIKTHSQSGYDILKDVEFPWPVARMILEHHERIDGSGYPNGLIGENILMESKILAIADTMEAIASNRPYRAGKGINVALDEIITNRGILYDADAVDACLRLFRKKGFQLEGTIL
jgi:HD-GYP domain-containing protein (c-di-GMP phosphodiesterase class II)/FixJ family two-component response regulator